MIKAGVTDIPTSLEGIAEVADDLVNKGGEKQHCPWNHGWFFEEFVCKQGLPAADNETDVRQCHKGCIR
ncbi:MAG: hypothetical protein ACLUGJ_16235 [Blautia wexlerae]